MGKEFFWGDKLIVYIVMIAFALFGIRVLTIGVSGALLYHKRVEARAKTGKRYVITDPETRIKNRSSGQYGKPDGDVHVKSAVFTYEENGKAVRATAVNLVGDDNLYLDTGGIYTIRVSPFNPHKCYFPPVQLYKGYSIPAKVMIFVKRLLPRLGGVMFLAIAYITYTCFIIE